MTTFNAGDIVLLELPLTGREKPARRPAVVVNAPAFTASTDQLVVLPLTTRRQTDPAMAIKLWESYGLPKASWIKPQLVTISKKMVVRTISSLADADHNCVRRALRVLIDEKW